MADWRCRAHATALGRQFRYRRSRRRGLGDGWATRRARSDCRSPMGALGSLRGACVAVATLRDGDTYP